MNNGNPKVQSPKSNTSYSFDFPEEYKDGYVIFMGERFKVDPRALIPRLETEELVKYALRILQKYPEIQTVADIGTGCGIIPISIAMKVGRELQIFATDMSKEALELAEENFHQIQNAENKIQNTKSLDSTSRPSTSSGLGWNDGIIFLHGNLLQPIIAHFGDSSPDTILITANLPYVREKEINSGLTHEPHMAFLGGEVTGFELYEKFFHELLAWDTRPKICHVVIEFGLWQRDIAESFFQQFSLQYTFFEDLRGIERFAYTVVSLPMPR